MNAAPPYEFGDVRFDVARMIVSRAGQPIDLEPKAVDVLRFLIEHRDRLVTKDELLDAVWRDTFVTPNVLTRAVAQLRKGIGDDAHESRYIETVAKRGYRFIAPVAADAVRAVAPATSEAEAPGPPPPRTQAARAVPFRILAATIVLVVAAIAAFLALRPIGDNSPPGATTFPTVRRIIGGSGGYYVEPTLSPDGHAVAYASDKSGGLEIYVNGVVPGSREIAITSDGGQNRQPRWSPDGQWIAFHSQARGGIWIVAATGGVARQVAEFGSQPAWSPDSQRLAFESYEGAVALQSVIWIVRRDGSDRRRLTAPGSPVGGHHSPSWSHDGRHFVFGRVSAGSTTDLWTVGVDGGSPTLLAGSGPLSGLASGNAQFAPDDGAVYFSGTTVDGNGRLFKLAIDRETLESTGLPQPILSYADGLSAGLTISPRGTAVYGLSEEDSNLWAVDWPSAGEPIRLTDGKRNFRPAYSRTGRIAYMNQEVGQGFTIWLMAEDGSGQEPLIPSLQGFQPQWSPDGTRVLVRDNLKDASFVWVDANTRRVTPLSLGDVSVGEVRPSPTSAEVVFHMAGENGVLNLWTQSLAGGSRRQITFDRESVSYPTWSADGRSIAAELQRGADTHVVVVPAQGGKVEQLTFDHGQSWPNTWSPDGEWIAFAGQRGAVWNLWAVSTRTHQTRQLTHFQDAVGYVRWPAWSPDGHRIIFERNQVRAGIWLAQLP